MQRYEKYQQIKSKMNIYKFVKMSKFVILKDFMLWDICDIYFYLR